MRYHYHRQPDIGPTTRVMGHERIVKFELFPTGLIGSFVRREKP